MDIFGFISKIFNIGKTYSSLSSFIDRQINSGTLFEHRLPFMDILDGRNLIFYKTDISMKQRWTEFLSQTNDDIKKIIAYKSIIIIDQNKIITILFEWSGLHDLLNLFEKFKDDSMKRKLFILRYDVDRCLSYLSKTFSEVVDKFEGLVIKGEKIEIFKTVIPDKAVTENRIVSIPDKDRIPIDKIDIYIDPSCSITSVRLYGSHPNADSNGWYCLGELKFSPLSVDSINKLLEHIKCYQLKDCYWKPQNYKEWIDNSQGV